MLFTASFRLKAAVQQLLSNLCEIVDFALLHPVRAMQKAALQETVDYIQENMASALGVYTPKQVFDIAMQHVDSAGHYVEFGVFKGGSIRYIASKEPKRTIHGFDSFEGLPSAWSGYTMDKGTFSLGGRLPRVPQNVRLYPGWFDASIPKWLDAFPGPIAFAHVDCDIYSSTKTIFDLIGPRIVPGTVIVFDEYFGYPHWRNHEFKAFQEFVRQHGVKYEYLVYSRIQVAVKILQTGQPSQSH